MIPSDFFVEVADYQTDLEALRAVREPVFVQEQQVPIEEEWDALDPLSLHVIARDLQRHPIGAGRLTPERKIGRMAVLRDWRGKGVGAAMLQLLLDQARARGYAEVALNAQVDAMGFYRGFGFEPYGEEFMEAGIRHQAMRRAIDPPETIDRAPPQPVPADREKELSTQEQVLAATLELLGDARRQVWIYTRDLEPLLYAHRDVMEEFKRLGVQGRSAEIRILLQDPEAVLKYGHPLMPLVQRLASTFHIRKPSEEVDLQHAAAFLLNDRGGFLHRPIGSRWEGVYNLHGPGHHRQLLDYFSSVWERAQPCSELRVLGI